MEMPEEIGGYRVEGILGRGSSGLVLRVHDEALDRSLALKLLSGDVDNEARGRFLIEAKAAARIIHPNVVQVYAVGEHQGRAFITQELVDGYPLSSLLEARGRLSAPAVIDIAIQVAEGLSKANEMGVLHRDVKPQNLLVTDEGTVKLADFGVAKLMDAPNGLTEQGTTVGTPHYMSPEQSQGRPLDGRADQYSLGATLYHMLAGQPPFDADNVLSLLMKHVQDPLVPLAGLVPDCPPVLARVVEKMLAKDKDQRFHGFHALVEALEDARASLEPPLLLEGEAAPPSDDVLALVKAATSQGLPRLPTQVVPPKALAKGGRLREALVVGTAGAAAIAVIVVAVLLDQSPGSAITPPNPPKPPPPAKVAPPPVVEPKPEPKPEPDPELVLKKRRSNDPVSELMRDLEKGDPVTAERAARELGKRGSQNATPALVAALERGLPVRVAVAAAEALADLGDLRAIEPLKKAEASAKAPAVREAAQKARQRLYNVEGE